MTKENQLSNNLFKHQKEDPLHKFKSIKKFLRTSKHLHNFDLHFT
jgi:hypothetical protein